MVWEDTKSSFGGTERFNPLLIWPRHTKSSGLLISRYPEVTGGFFIPCSSVLYSAFASSVHHSLAVDKATAAATVAVASLPLPVKSPSRCPSSRGFPLKRLPLWAVAAGRAVWRNPDRDVSSRRIHPACVGYNWDHVGSPATISKLMRSFWQRLRSIRMDAVWSFLAFP